ncbi:MAG TPA: enoyl-CoA hydratase/isomerase family protein [Geminicoccaceae bacterium]|nr:enoyl-CoA hydratase/isomerase family protein [Geminicoccus sp.]HMU50151.1 enoyl-CoA hydratase/isomerase family protein [Geminicoccaceae bacterium]
MSGPVDIRFERRGGLGVAVLDRPAALNALTREMVQALSLQLAAWKDDPEVAAVLVKASGGRAFCAGGDIRAVTDLARTRGVEAAAPFFHDEYRLNWRISQFPKPYVALLDGVTMGGGVGISAHGRYRVVTEQTLVAMPETLIGFFPDVGGTWVLSRQLATGMYLGLTGARLQASDALEAGFGTHFVPRDRLAALEELLAGGEPVDAALDSLRRDPPPGTLPGLRQAVEQAFDAPTLAEIERRLGESEWGRERLAELARRSPLALAVTFAQLRRGAGMADLAEALRLEYRMVHRFLAGRDFAEGVRALLVDKDNRPRWSHAGIAEVSPDEVEAVMAPLPGGDLAFDWQGV